MAKFDPYLKWLGIRHPERPPNHYRLLGIEDFESDREVIAAAADRQMAHVRTFQTGPHSDEAHRLLNELAIARTCLLAEERRLAYDGSHLGHSFESKNQPAAETDSKPSPDGNESLEFETAADREAEHEPVRVRKTTALFGASVLSTIIGVGLAIYFGILANRKAEEVVNIENQLDRVNSEVESVRQKFARAQKNTRSQNKANDRQLRQLKNDLSKREAQIFRLKQQVRDLEPLKGNAANVDDLTRRLDELMGSLRLAELQKQQLVETLLSAKGEAKLIVYRQFIRNSFDRIKESKWDEARATLDSIDKEMRGWEWHALDHLVASEQNNLGRLKLTAKGPIVSDREDRFVFTRGARFISRYTIGKNIYRESERFRISPSLDNFQFRLLDDGKTIVVVGTRSGKVYSQLVDIETMRVGEFSDVRGSLAGFEPKGGFLVTSENEIPLEFHGGARIQTGKLSGEKIFAFNGEVFFGCTRKKDRVECRFAPDVDITEEAFELQIGRPPAIPRVHVGGDVLIAHFVAENKIYVFERLDGKYLLQGDFPIPNSMLDLAIDPKTKRVFCLYSRHISVCDLYSGFEYFRIPYTAGSYLYFNRHTGTLYASGTRTVMQALSSR